MKSLFLSIRYVIDSSGHSVAHVKTLKSYFVLSVKRDEIKWKKMKMKFNNTSQVKLVVSLVRW